jgi:hypothetical protein
LDDDEVEVEPLLVRSLTACGGVEDFWPVVAPSAEAAVLCFCAKALEAPSTNTNIVNTTNLFMSFSFVVVRFFELRSWRYGPLPSVADDSLDVR